MPSRKSWDKERQKQFLQNFAKTLNINSPKDWGKVSAAAIRKNGGEGLLKVFNGSIYSALNSIFPSIGWKVEWFKRAPRNLWIQREKQREFFDDLAKKLSIQKMDDWNKVTKAMIVENGGKRLLHSHFRGSLKYALKTIYPEHDWKNSNIEKSETQIFENIAKELKINRPRDWGNITHQILEQYDALKIIRKYGNSLYNCLKTIYPGSKKKTITYPDIKWQENWFTKSHGYWKEIKNRRKFFDELQLQLGIESPSDWGKLPHSKLIIVRETGMLSYYNGSLIKALMSIYPEVQWKLEWFSKAPRKHWQDEQNQRRVFEDIGRRFQIFKYKDWGKLTPKIISENGGGIILGMHGGSLLKTLQTLFPEIIWKDEWFTHQRFPNYHWHSLSNQRSFLEQIAAKYSLDVPAKWQRVSQSLIIRNGGKGLLNQYKNSIQRMLDSIYGTQKWGRMSLTSTPQESVIYKINQLF